MDTDRFRSFYLSIGNNVQGNLIGEFTHLQYDLWLDGFIIDTIRSRSGNGHIQGVGDVRKRANHLEYGVVA